MLHVADVELVKDGKPILHDLNLQVGEAEIRSILGVNGTGKSTLAYAIMGLSGYEPTAGRILFEGEDITRLSISERAKRGITLAWQEPARFEGLAVAEYLEIARRSAGNGNLDARECLRKVGLQPESYLGRAVDRILSLASLAPGKANLQEGEQSHV
jgi:Fe-S cluster assembly ATP-binding protein